MNVEQLHFFRDELEKLALSPIRVGAAIKSVRGKVRGGVVTNLKRKVPRTMENTQAQIRRIERMAREKARRGIGPEGGALAGRTADVARQHTPRRLVGVGGTDLSLRRGVKLDPSWENVDQVRSVANPTVKKNLFGTTIKPSSLVGGKVPSMRGSNPKTNVATGKPVPTHHR